MKRRPPRSTRVRSSAASDVYKRQLSHPGNAGGAERLAGMQGGPFQHHRWVVVSDGDLDMEAAEPLGIVGGVDRPLRVVVETTRLGRATEMLGAALRADLSDVVEHHKHWVEDGECLDRVVPSEEILGLAVTWPRIVRSSLNALFRVSLRWQVRWHP